jgi:uncharacterized membrane protein YfcA
MSSNKLIFVLVVISTTLIATTFAESSSECSTVNQYECPSADGKSFSLVGDCLNCPNYMFSDSKHNLCANRVLFGSDEHYHYLGNDIAGIIVWFLTAGIATACGVGGGGIYVPLGILLLSFGAKPSSGLSQASIFGASLGGLTLNVFNNHPNTEIVANSGEKAESESAKSKYYTRPLIDYNMVLFLAPMEMAGATLGVLIQKLLPNWLYLSVASIVLGITAWKTYGTYLKKREAEIAEKELTVMTKDTINVSVGGENGYTNVAMGDDVTKVAKEEEQEAGNSSTSPSSLTTITIDLPKQIEFLENDQRQFPMEKVGALLVMWFGMIFFTFLIGGKGVKSVVGIECTDTAYPVLVLLQFLWLFGFAIYYGLNTVKEFEERSLVGYPWQQKDVRWSNDILLLYAKFSFFAGIVAGLIGIGGGMVLGPFMLAIGIDPRVSSATTATMIVLTSSAVAVIYVTTGLIPISYFICFFSVCFVGAIIGKKNIDSFVKRTGMASLLVGILAAIIALATIGCITNLFIRLDEREWCLDGFKSFCD